jgi:hypothetical protein
MTRRDLIALLGSTAVSWPVGARAQQMMTKTNVPTIGWLVTGSPTSYRNSLAAFRDGLTAAGMLKARISGSSIGGLRGMSVGFPNWLAIWSTSKWM